ncbi:PTS system mannose/fructose/sorbose family transporter subunit IID, partial [Anaerorhabdus sp.]|uniref:PTS system mannose/fructose/sorbose family transporter subunit IID n=1 Tax=Anaerorhabdus sp. TaxID=1872524 RepID=UPI002FC6FC8E
MTENKDLRRVSKKDLWKTYIYSQAFVSGFNYSKQEAPGFVFSMMPVIEKVYEKELAFHALSISDKTFS